MPITDVTLIPLTPRQIAIFAGLEQELQQFQSAIRQRINDTGSAIIAGQLTEEDSRGCTFSVTPDGLRVTPSPAQPQVERSLKLESLDETGS